MFPFRGDNYQLLLVYCHLFIGNYWHLELRYCLQSRVLLVTKTNNQFSAREELIAYVVQSTVYKKLIILLVVVVVSVFFSSFECMFGLVISFSMFMNSMCIRRNTLSTRERRDSPD